MGALRARVRRLDVGAAGPPTRRELTLLAVAMAVGLVVRIAYWALFARTAPMVGDEAVYDAMGRLAAAGHWFWGDTPYGIAHPTMWKPPGYPAWLGVWYSVLGPGRGRVELVQALLGPVVIGLSWLLARRLLGNVRLALAAAAVVALYPLAWQYEELLYPEALAVPVTLVLLLAGLERRPTWRRAVLVGAIAGVALLIRPNAFVPLLGIAAGWIVLAGARRGLAAGALAVLVAALVVAPWTVRNHAISGAFVPISLQDGAIAGTFNATSAHDPDFPYAWRPVAPRDADLFDPRHPLGEVQLLHELRSRGLHYIAAHPGSVPAAFFWNGITRTWDVRRPGHAMGDVRFEGGSPGVTLAGWIVYWLLVPLALVGLWRLRARRSLLVAVAVIALASSLVLTVASGTRYRAPLEPLIVVLACAGAASLLARRPARA